MQNDSNNPFETFDNYVCEKFQQLSDWLQDITDRNCFWFAGFALFLKMVLVVYSFLFVERVYGRVVASFIVGLIMIRGILVIKESVGTSKNTANPLRHHPVAGILRMCSFGAILGDIWRLASQYIKGAIEKMETVYFIDSILLICLVYFLACTPRPGGKYYMGKWADAIINKLVGQPGAQGV